MASTTDRRTAIAALAALFVLPAAAARATPAANLPPCAALRPDAPADGADPNEVRCPACGQIHPR